MVPITIVLVRQYLTVVIFLGFKLYLFVLEHCVASMGPAHKEKNYYPFPGIRLMVGNLVMVVVVRSLSFSVK